MVEKAQKMLQATKQRQKIEILEKNGRENRAGKEIQEISRDYGGLKRI